MGARFRYTAATGVLRRLQSIRCAVLSHSAMYRMLLLLALLPACGGDGGGSGRTGGGDAADGSGGAGGDGGAETAPDAADWGPDGSDATEDAADAEDAERELGDDAIGETGEDATTDSVGLDAERDALADATPADAGTDATPVDAWTDATPVDAWTDATPVDAGADATPVDAGADATPVDAGTDATPVDAGTDATPVDAWTDATPVDAGADATPVDAGADATPVDAGTDATPVDAGGDAGDPPVVEPVCGLLVNGNAETGDLTGWAVEQGTFEATEGSFWGGRPDAFEGSWSFMAGTSAASVLVQHVDVSDQAEAIDADLVTVVLTARVRSGSDGDGGSLLLFALDADDELLASAAAGPFTTDAWTERTVALLAPPGTRTVKVGLRGDRDSGTDNDAYFDAADLCISAEPPDPPDGDLTGPPYLMWSTQDGVSVRWETASASVGRVEYGTGGAFTGSVLEPAARTSHEVRLSGLSPGTLYDYRVSWGGASPLPSRTFETAPLPDDEVPVDFLVWGDNQDGPDTFRTIVQHMNEVPASFAVSVGDCVQNGTRREYREQLFGPISPIADHVPFLVGAGNHERYSDSGAALFAEYMSQPGNEHCFGWRWGPIYFQFIDTEDSVDPGSPQHQCIADGLSSDEATSAQFQAAVFHKPPRIEWWFGGLVAFPPSMEAPQVREILEPMFEDRGVDIVFNGHNHLYAHTPETPGGIVWVTTGGGGGAIDTNFALWRVGTWPEIETTIHDHHFLSVHIEDGVMDVSAIDADGSVVHGFRVVPD